MTKLKIGRSFEQIIGSFQKAATQLDNLSSRMNSEMARLQQEKTQIDVCIDQAADQKTKAENASEKIKTLICVD